ncbi:protein phosphatase 2C 57 [Impatiens glandulifera]|uniref:protein phosphatase 2C 57 n=1 Tax=Impatiens glandulifera TaxID=253017 RepID=UPI001FB0B8F0|nr:protein phosphatase 2C 57 [Impatiens glandulifera]
MALPSPPPQLHKFISNRTDYICNSSYCLKFSPKNTSIFKGRRTHCCSAIAVDAPSFSTGLTGIRFGSALLQGAREEMEDDAVIVKSDQPDGFSFAAVFDGHAGYSSVKFLRSELYKECLAALQGGLLLKGKDFNSIEKALKDAFGNVDAKLINWLEETGEDIESGSTATVLFIGNEKVVIAHLGDSLVALSRSGKTDILTDGHRPYGNKKTALDEVRRIREAGGWISNGRICGDISVSRAFGDMRFKTKKEEMMQKGIEEGRWTEKFASRIQFKGDLVTATPDIFQIPVGSDAELLLLASDGLWDYMTSSDAVNFLRNQLRQHGDVQLACEALGQAALDGGSQDNISIIVADLGRTDWQSLPVAKENILIEVIQVVATIGVVSFGIWLSSALSI